MMPHAHNRCTRCSHEWYDVPGAHTQCPICGHAYVEWLNYAEQFNERH